MRLRSLLAGLLAGISCGAVTAPVSPAAVEAGMKALTLPIALRAVVHMASFETPAILRPASSEPAGSGPGHAGLQPDGRRPLLQGRHEATIQLLSEAADRHEVEPSLVLALSFWESAWDESRVSSTGAVGLMQIQPEVAAAEGPRLVGREVDLQDPYDNADLGAAILKANLEAYGSKERALAAYYQGASSLEQDGPYPDTQQYVQGILALAAQIAAGHLPR